MIFVYTSTIVILVLLDYINIPGKIVTNKTGKFLSMIKRCYNDKAWSYIETYLRIILLIAIKILFVGNPLFDCSCRNLTKGGYGNCQKRSSRMGGNFLCAIKGTNETSACGDVQQEPKTKIFVSAEACGDLNIGKEWISLIYEQY